MPTDDPKVPVSALSLTKELHERLATGQDISNNELQRHLRSLNKLFSEQERALKRARRDFEAQTLRHTTELDALRSEVHCELVDREANAARISERQRFLFERPTAQAGQAAANERASASAAYVEAALVALCPHSNPRSSGCDQISSAL